MNYVQSSIVCANITIQGSHYFYKNTNSTVNGTNTPVHFFRNTYFLWSLFNLDFLKCYFLTWWPLKTTCQHHHLMKLLESGTDCRQTATRFPLSGSTSQWPLIKRTDTQKTSLSKDVATQQLAFITSVYPHHKTFISPTATSLNHLSLLFIGNLRRSLHHHCSSAGVWLRGTKSEEDN